MPTLQTLADPLPPHTHPFCPLQTLNVSLPHPTLFLSCPLLPGCPHQHAPSLRCHEVPCIMKSCLPCRPLQILSLHTPIRYAYCGPSMSLPPLLTLLPTYPFFPIAPYSQAALTNTLHRSDAMRCLVESYTGPPRATAREENARLAETANQLPGSAPQPFAAFTQRALLTLQVKHVIAVSP